MSSYMPSELQVPLQNSEHGVPISILVPAPLVN